jgi:non-lysosomal glucosylceramidase
MNEKRGFGRRGFLQTVVAASAAPVEAQTAEVAKPGAAAAAYPRVFTGAQLAMLSFPLGGVGAGSIGLGGRGQLRDWEIVNRSDKGNAPSYAMPSIWAQIGSAKPVARVLEARIQPPYEGQSGLGSKNAPGLSRLESATFTGEFPVARVDFHDRTLPVEVSLTAGTPFIPLDADASGLPMTALRYRVRNRSRAAATVSIAWSIENPVTMLLPLAGRPRPADTRVNEVRKSERVAGLLMQNPQLDATDPGKGTFAVAVLDPADGEVTTLRGWPAGRWWNSPLLFWDDFTADGSLGPESAKPGNVGAVCLKREIPAGGEAEFAFVLAWHFPNRTPGRCGWSAPKGHENDVIGNWYATKFGDAWAVAEYAAAHLPELERRTRTFVTAMRESTLPAAVKDAAMANLSTLVSTTCFRTADGEFHGFEGANDHGGCCHGNCTHVWNYETATAHVFPSLSRSLRRSAFGYSLDEQGAMYFRQSLPDGIERMGHTAADGQMGQVMKVYLDWQLSGDDAFLREFWPKAKRALEFAWVPGGWDADRDGVMEGVQHNTYDVEFYGPNPLCGVYYLGALRAAEEMARAVGDDASAREYRRLFDGGSQWIDANLFTGEYYIQKVRAFKTGEIAKLLRSNMGADDPEHPEYQMGDGCLVDQLLGQYLADVAGLGPLLAPANIRKTLDSIWRYNYKAKVAEHDSVQRTYVLNDEAALVVCDYAKGKRPTIPFPYYAEAWTGLEYSTAALLMYQGMTEHGVQSYSDVRARYDGVRRNPWDEPECGHHYARAMSSWSGVLAMSGFRYGGPERRVVVAPRARGPFRSFWSAGPGWGSFSLTARQLEMRVDEGTLPVRKVEIAMAVRSARVTLAGVAVPCDVETRDGRAIVTLRNEVTIGPTQALRIDA